MTHSLNGINYTEMLLTDEETAVVKAMRKGADVAVNFHNLNEINEVDERMDLFGEISGLGLRWIEERERESGSNYITFYKKMKKISVACFLELGKD